MTIEATENGIPVARPVPIDWPERPAILARLEAEGRLRRAENPGYMPAHLHPVTGADPSPLTRALLEERESELLLATPLKAIHLATARQLDKEFTALLTDGGRLAKAAADAGVQVVTPRGVRQQATCDHKATTPQRDRSRIALMGTHTETFESIGRRIAEARGRADWTQARLADAVGLDPSDLAKIETGHHRVSALELTRLADALDMRIEWFVEDAPPAIIARRNTQEPGAPSPRIDAAVERVTRAVEFAARHDERFTPAETAHHEMPADAAQADLMAATTRDAMGAERAGPLTQLADKTFALGLLAFSLGLGVDSADAATVLLRSGGVSVINGDRHVGRRRLALAHELGHYLVADDYTVDWRVAEYQGSEVRESLFDRFARALLLPEDDMRAAWHRHTTGPQGDPRTAAVRIASCHRVDMTTLALRLCELDIITRSDAGRMRSIRTTRADIVELDLVVGVELEPPALPQEYERAVLRLYRSETISSARALGLLLDTWDEQNLPELPTRSENEIWQFV